MINEERLVNEFMELVQIDSETKNEAAIAKVLKEKFGALGVEVLKMIQQQSPVMVQGI